MKFSHLNLLLLFLIMSTCAHNGNATQNILDAFTYLYLSDLNTPPTEYEQKQCSEKYKPNKKVVQLWDSVSKYQTLDIKTAAHFAQQIVMKEKLFDEYAFKGRQIIADCFIETDDMASIYEQYKYFMRYSVLFPRNELARFYREALKDRYLALLKHDLENENVTGLYFSDMVDDNYMPYMAISVKTVDGGVPTVKIIPGCGLAESVSMYNSFGEAKNDFGNPCNVTNSDDMTYFGFWGDKNLKPANAEMAKSLMEGAIGFRSNVYGEMAKYNFNLEQSMTATVATELVVGLVSLLASNIGTSKATTKAINLSWNKERPGTYNAVIDMAIEKISSNNAPELKQEKYSCRLYKIYPHYELLFKRNAYKFLIATNAYTTDKAMEKFHPYGITGSMDALNDKELNHLSYKLWAWYHVYMPYLKKDSMLNYAPDIDKMSYFYDKDKREMFISIYDDKHKQYETFMASKKCGGNIEFYEIKDGKANGTGMGYYTTGVSYIAQFENNRIRGNYQLKQGDSVLYDGQSIDGRRHGLGRYYYSDNMIYQGEWRNNKREGLGTLIYQNGDAFVGEFRNDTIYSGQGVIAKDSLMIKCRIVDGIIDGDCVVKYDNGDEYTGPVKNYLPHGKGSIVYANGKKETGEWENGVKKVTKKKRRNRRR